MYLAELAEVAIGLVVVYFLVSMACSQILEWFSQFFIWHSRDLEAAIRAMILNEPIDVPVIRPIRWLWRNITGRFKGAAADSGKEAEKLEAEKLIEQLYKHPLIKSLASKYPILGTEIKPDYIPTRAFALALFDTVMTAGTEASRIQEALATVRNTVSPDPKVIEQLDNLIKQAAVVIDQNEQALLDKLKQELDGLKAAYPNLQPQIDALLSIGPKTDPGLTQFTHSLQGLAANNLDLKRTLESLVSQAALSVEKGEATLATARTNVEAWFDANMDQLTDLYKRRSKLWSGVIALVLAVILNVDTLVIANTLWREPSLRQMVVAYAEKLQPPPVTTPTATSAISPTQAMTPTQYISPTVTIMDLEQRLQGLQLPIRGWEIKSLGVTQDKCQPVPWTKDVWGIWWYGDCKGLFLQDLKPGPSGALAKLVGWLITAAAAAQGAPFWFDLLNKLLQLRGGEKKPEEKAATAQNAQK